jgi:hypothetical protein
LLSVYWERWEIEQSLGGLKNSQLNSKITLRSRFPEGVRQNLWDVLLGYNLIRLEVVHIAQGMTPSPKKLQLMREDVKHFILPKK